MKNKISSTKLAEDFICKQADVNYEETWIEDDVRDAFLAGWAARGKEDLKIVDTIIPGAIRKHIEALDEQD